MTSLPSNSSDNDLIAVIDGWVTLLEKEEYEKAFTFTDHDEGMNWSPDLIKEAIKGYGEASPTQRATLLGKPTDISQRKGVTRWAQNKRKAIGEVWYDLNIDGFASDLTATFRIVVKDDGLVLCLNDIHVM